MTPTDDVVPLLPPMTSEQIDDFYRVAKQRPLTEEELAFYHNPQETVPMDDLLQELERTLETNHQEGVGR